MLEQLADCLEQQLDLELEAESLLSLARNLAAMEGVVVPSPLLELSGPSALVMDYIPDLRPREPAAADEAFSIAALRALRAVYQMLFLDGFVHCDLHPGNLYPRTDGSVVLLDAGFSCRISGDARRAFASFFYRMSRGEGSACADLVIDSARAIGPDADRQGLHRSICELVDRNTRAAISDFDLVGFTVELFDAQRGHGFLADPEFVIPILSLIVLEGTLRELCPEVDFQLEALPFVLRGLLV
jgi:ubiquinone biosynthesis protein